MVDVHRLRPGNDSRQFGAKGVLLTSQDTLEDVTVRTADDEVAILRHPVITWGR
jgi:hypothetical protein